MKEHDGHVLHMGAQWVHGVCPENSMFKLAEKHNLLNLEMEREGNGDMDHLSFDLEHIYLKNGQKVPEKLALKAGEIYTEICKKLQALYTSDESIQDQSVEDIFFQEADIALKT